MRRFGLLIVVGAVAVLAGCSGETAVPIDLDNPPVLDDRPSDPDVTHPLSPTPQMERLARQQCLDDPTLDEGYIRAVDPAGGAIMSEFSVDCDEVRAGP